MADKKLYVFQYNTDFELINTCKEELSRETTTVDKNILLLVIQKLLMKQWQQHVPQQVLLKENIVQFVVKF